MPPGWVELLTNQPQKQGKSGEMGRKWEHWEACGREGLATILVRDSRVLFTGLIIHSMRIERNMDLALQHKHKTFELAYQPLSSMVVHH